MKPTILLAALLATGAHASSNCDSIREQIDAKVRAAGVTRFTLTVVDTAASAPGRNVGSCDRGSRKILYVQEGRADNDAAASAPAAKPPPKPVLTECKDGTVSVGGDCRKP